MSLQTELNNLRSGDIEFLHKLGQDLSKPINPNASTVEYTISQYICEYIKKSNHQGVSSITVLFRRWDQSRIV